MGDPWRRGKSKLESVLRIRDGPGTPKTGGSKSIIQRSQADFSSEYNSAQCTYPCYYCDNCADRHQEWDGQQRKLVQKPCPHSRYAIYVGTDHPDHSPVCPARSAYVFSPTESLRPQSQYYPPPQHFNQQSMPPQPISMPSWPHSPGSGDDTRNIDKLPDTTYHTHEDILGDKDRSRDTYDKGKLVWKYSRERLYRRVAGSNRPIASDGLPADEVQAAKVPAAPVTLEDFLELERHILTGPLTPVTEETFSRWKQEKVNKADEEPAAPDMKKLTGREVLEQSEWQLSEDDDDESDGSAVQHQPPVDPSNEAARSAQGDKLSESSRSVTSRMLKFLRPPILPGHERVEWTCSCGLPVYSDYPTDGTLSESSLSKALPRCMVTSGSSPDLTSNWHRLWRDRRQSLRWYLFWASMTLCVIGLLVAVVQHCSVEFGPYRPQPAATEWTITQRGAMSSFGLAIVNTLRILAALAPLLPIVSYRLNGPLLVTFATFATVAGLVLSQGVDHGLKPLLFSSALVFICIPIISYSPHTTSIVSSSPPGTLSSDPTQSQSSNTSARDVAPNESRNITSQQVEVDRVECIALRNLDQGVRMFFELCVDHGRLRTSLGEICFNDDQGVRTIGTDFQLFARIKETYEELRRKGVHKLLYSPSDIHFVEFSVHAGGSHVAVHDGPLSIPPADEVKAGRYHYYECPLKPALPMDRRLFFHYFWNHASHQANHNNESNTLFLNRLPKKLGDSILRQYDPDKMCTGWGVRILEGPNKPVLAWLATFILVVSFLISLIYDLAAKKHESGFAIGQWIVAVLATALTAVYFHLADIA